MGLVIETRTLWCESCHEWTVEAPCPVCGREPKRLLWGIDEFTEEQLKAMARPRLRRRQHDPRTDGRV